MSTVLKNIRNIIKYWWVGTILGILFILLGIWVFQTPIESFLALSIFFAFTYLISGVGRIFFSVSNRQELEGWGWQLAGGILELLLGMALLANPAVSMIILSFFVGFWLMFNGISTISMSIDLKKYDEKGWFWILLFGILTTVLAFLVLVNPLYAVSFLSVFISLSLIFSGLAQIMISFKLKKIKRKVEKVAT